MTRIKLNGPTIKSRAEAEQAMGDVRQLAIERNSRLLYIEKRRKEIEDNEAERLGEIAAEINAVSERLRVWAEANMAEFGDKKTLELTHGKMGWRLGNPTLKPLRGYTWASVVDALRDVAPEYVRKREEPNKEAILSDREKIGVDKLRLLGVRMVQDEPFYVEPNIEEPENRVVMGKG